MKTGFALALMALLATASAWGNGFSIWDNPVFTDDYLTWQRGEMYGTHDYLAQKAWEMLADEAPEEAEWIRERQFYYGTGLPDSDFKGGLNNRAAQYMIFDSTGNLVDDSLADQVMGRKNYRYDALIDSLDSEAHGTASELAGMMVSHVSNAGLFSRVIDNPQKGFIYEIYVLQMTDIVYPSDDFEKRYGDYIHFDGELEMISPYDATIRLGRQTYLGEDGECSARWMDENYDTEDPQFIECEGRNFNNIVNAMVDVLHTVYQTGVEGESYDLDAYDWQDYQEPAPEEPEEMTTEEPEEAPEEPEEDVPEEEAPEEGPEIQPFVYEPPPEPEKRTDLGIWVYVIPVVLIAVIAVLTFRNVGRKKARKSLKGRRTRRER